MKKTILRNGLIAGTIIAAFMVASTAWVYKDANFEDSFWIGISSMIASFAFVFIGVKQFRDQESPASLSFWKAFQVGAGIAFIASSIYVLVWLVEYYTVFPDFMEKYSAHALKVAAAKGPEEVAAKTAEMAEYSELYKNPVWVILLTYMEVLPIGLVVAVISAFALKKKG
jgi:hypothetical protein